MDLPASLKPDMYNNGKNSTIAEIPLKLADGNCITFFISSESGNSESILIIDEAEANQMGEAKYQLLEGQNYEYKIDKEYIIEEIPGVIKTSRLNRLSGRISTGIYVGTLQLVILDKATKTKQGSLSFEIRSTKASYRDDYRNMLSDIAAHSADLLMQHTSPVDQLFTIDFNKKAETIYQRFAFIKSILDSDEFNQALHRILSSPMTGWEYIYEEADIRKARHFSHSQLRQIASRTDRIPVPGNHELKEKLDTVPSKLSISRKIETLDIPENRFIRHILNIFLHFCSEVKIRLKPERGRYIRAYSEVIIVEERLQNILNHGFFKSLSNPSSLPMNSPVMQRREGYREFLRFWLMFEFAAKLIWQGGEDVYRAGKRDVAVLYEYWLFFKLLEMMRDIFTVNQDSVKGLIEPTADGLGLKLKSGHHVALDGFYEADIRKLRMEFSYNKTFSGANEYPSQGSWTRNMRPDYTLSVWPFEFSMPEAEKQELIVHIHFDAKYKVDYLKEIFGAENENLDEEKQLQRAGTYKRGDLLKMHAYKDAIRRTAGAYILYPGNDRHSIMKGFHEIIPGLGAFSIKPSKEDNGIDSLKGFINDVLFHFLDRANQFDRMSFYNWTIHKEENKLKVHERLPEQSSRERILPPSDTNILIGYYKSKEHHDWIQKEGLYNVRMNDARGSVRISAAVAGARYILLHSEGKTVTNDIWQIVENGPRIFSKEKMKEHKYPDPKNDNYLVYKIIKIPDGIFGKTEWDLSPLLKQNGSGRKSAFPFAVTLTELMEAKVKLEG